MERSVRDIKRDRDRKRRDEVKGVLATFAFNLELANALELEIERKRDRLDSLKSGVGNPNPSKGGGSSQEDLICKVLDDIKVLEDEFSVLVSENLNMHRLIKGLDDPIMVRIVYGVWVERSASMRELASRFNLSHTMIWKKSDVALLRLYKLIGERAFG